MSIGEFADLASRHAVWFWLAVSAPGMVLGFVTGYEGNRLVRQSIAEGNTSAPGARLLRFVGTCCGVVQLAFVIVGILSIINLIEMPATAVPGPTSLHLRRLGFLTTFLVVPPLVVAITMRVLRFLSPSHPYNVR